MERIDLNGPYPRIVKEDNAIAPAPMPARQTKRLWNDVFFCMGLFGLLLAFAQTVMQAVQTLIDIVHR